MVSDFAKSISNRAPRYLAGGFDPNDFYKIVANIDTWDDWLLGVSHYADERYELAEEALQKGRFTSAGEYYIEAGLYYHFAQLGYFADIERKYALKRKSIAAYSKGMPYDRPPIKRLDIPYEEINMSAHLRFPSSQGPFPLVILLPGVDSTKEEYHAFSDVLVKRNLATLAFEGLGQGETRFFRAMTDDYEKAFSTALDYLSSIRDIDQHRIAVYGRSMGGYLAPRVAAKDKRVKAVVSAGGIYEMSYWDKLPETTRHNFRHAWGCENFKDAKARAFSMSLEGIINKIDCPFLILHSKNDSAFPYTGALRMKSEAHGNAELLIYDEGTHVCDNIKYKYQRYVSDWIVNVLKIDK